ncbi:multidrug resistance efflux transporter family protein [Cytobacillus firmus]|uniref:DMT family transporter n=1 Tax=Cytobacillus firmus TaxID=1399 RepID=UPI001C940339|nr:multidrug resistance efflux transporter family protein [Cytobacillus firmus]MBY6054760.1 multidrug resistance efflux transporter family protein [Cytobacillus firmus]USK38870.1 multidrug resistance efflux transporter family protein [Cytobacillus firmus]WHY61696.1 multidrug resistance efflux transporter family protein [Cytobacillus firmus]
MKAILLGVCSAFFFAFTFVLNRAMEMDGGSWLWSASLRYFFMIPLLVAIVAFRGNLRPLFIEMKKAPGPWLLWSFVGFGLFYAPLCFAAAYGPGWLIAGTWQITIISGSLLAPFFFVAFQTGNGTVKVRGKIPFRGMMMSVVILLGVAVMQVEHASSISLRDTLLVIIPLIIASFAYPLGNRKMMDVCENRLDAYQRVLGMTIASLPFWFLLSFAALATSGVPSFSQVTQSGLVALFSGVFATVLFFAATDLVRGNMQKLGAVEATQSLEVLFAVLGEVALLSSPLPSGISLTGMALVIVGMALHSFVSSNNAILKRKAA